MKFLNYKFQSLDFDFLKKKKKNSCHLNVQTSNGRKNSPQQEQPKFSAVTPSFWHRGLEAYVKRWAIWWREVLGLYLCEQRRFCISQLPSGWRVNLGGQHGLLDTRQLHEGRWRGPLLWWIFLPSGIGQYDDRFFFFSFKAKLGDKFVVWKFKELLWKQYKTQHNEFFLIKKKKPEHKNLRSVILKLNCALHVSSWCVK